MKSLLNAIWLAIALQTFAFGANSTSQLPATLINYERPPFPLDLAYSSVHEGYATVAFIVSPEGRVTDAVVLEATHPGFGDAVLGVLPLWTFAAAKSPEALPTREVIRFEFKQTGVVTSLSHRDSAKSAFISGAERLPIRTVQAAQLATRPQRLTELPSKNPTGVTGTVSVNFVIDTSGRVRVPLADVSRDEAGSVLSKAALSIIKEWQYSPIVHDGRAVLVEVSRTLAFGEK